MGAFLAVLSFLTTLFKAIAEGLSLRKELEEKAKTQQRTDAVTRFNENANSIDCALAPDGGVGGVRDGADAATGPSEAPFKSPRATGGEGGGTKPNS